MKYTVNILDDKEFESLPFPETDTSFGIADPRTNTAYVRYTPNQDVMNYLVNHEVEHLIEGHGGQHSNHYRNGVYYKGLAEIFGGGQPEEPVGITGLIGRSVGQMQNQMGSNMGSMSPNVSSASGSGPGISQGGSSLGAGLGADVISRLKGFFSGRPSGGVF